MCMICLGFIVFTYWTGKQLQGKFDRCFWGDRAIRQLDGWSITTQLSQESLAADEKVPSLSFFGIWDC